MSEIVNCNPQEVNVETLRDKARMCDKDANFNLTASCVTSFLATLSALAILRGYNSDNYGKGQLAYDSITTGLSSTLTGFFGFKAFFQKSRANSLNTHADVIEAMSGRTVSDI